MRGLLSRAAVKPDHLGEQLAHGACMSVVKTIQEFYERHPYPGYVEGLDLYLASSEDHAAKRAEHHLFWPALPYREDHAVLVAGCGTMQAVKRAMRWPQASVVGIDISASSLNQAREFKSRYSLDNLELRQLAIERVGELDMQFDEIVCTGVLHHLPSPDEGLTALGETLAPRGAMQIMVYAPYGRAGVYLLQEYCRRLGVTGSSEDIRDLGQMLRLLPSDHPLWPLLQKSPDFRYNEGLADALLNPLDRAFSVPQLLSFIRSNGLRFGRWLRQAPYLPYCGVMATSPHFDRMSLLPPDVQHAAMELFRGDMVRHTAIVYRDDTSAAMHSFPLPGHALKSSRPIRLPATTSVTEQTPPGCAAVLLNRRHADRDIYLPVNSAEHAAYLEIDGSATVDQIAGRHRGVDVPLLLKKLWHHDQICFDTCDAWSDLNDLLRSNPTPA